MLRWTNAPFGSAGDFGTNFAASPVAVSELGWRDIKGFALPIMPIWYAVAANTAFYMVAWWGSVNGIAPVWRKFRGKLPGCQGCGYDVQSLPICPECGMSQCAPV
jgi:hypothetical protein